MHVEQIGLPDERVTALAHTIGVHDGRSTVNELGELGLAGQREATCLVARDGSHLTAFALIDHREQTVQLAVHPAHRRRGIGRSLAAEAARHPAARTWWAFGDSAGAQALARSCGLVKVRELLQMARRLGDERTAHSPAGFTLTAFTPSDAPAVVGVNAAAFAHHPEQGNLTLDDMHALTAQPWFDPGGLIVARDAADDRLVGFHWTKHHDGTTGEVYVLAVHPDAEGRGLGRALLDAGLAHLASTGHERVLLYVESSVPRVVAMYKAAKFVVTTTDASYAARGH